MSSPSRRFRPVVLLAMVALLFSAFAAPVTAKPPKDKSPIASAKKVVMFASDGMRPDLMQKYAKAGHMPTYAKLMKDGVTGDNGMLQAFPPNTGVGWFTMATGAYPADHGSTNNTYFRAGDSFTNRTSFSAAGVLQADTIADAAERAGKKVAQIDWVAGAASASQGPIVDFTNFFTNRGVLVGQADSVEAAGSAFFGVNYQDAAALVAASGWSDVPTGDPAAPPKEATWSVPSSFTAQNPDRTYNVYFYDSVVGGGAAFDHVIVSPVGKTGASPSVDLAVGDFDPIKLMGANGLIGTQRAGQTAGHYVKLISLTPDGTQFKLYLTSLTRAIARCGAVCSSLPAGNPGGSGVPAEDRLEKYIADNLLPWAAGDFAPLEAAVIDEDTYVEQGRDLERAYSLQVINYILGTLQPDTDLAMVGYPFTDEVSHQFLGLVSPTDADGNLNPCYDVNPKFDDTQCVGRGTAGRVAAREEYIRSAYADADEKLGVARSLMGGNPTTFAGSDHGFAPAYYAVNANAVLNQATVTSAPTLPAGDPAPPATFSLRASSGVAQNCNNRTFPVAAPTIANDIAKACWAGGTIQIYVNPARLRGSSTSADPSWPSYAEVRAAIRAAFEDVTDPAHPDAQVILKIMNKEELRNVDGSDSLHPNRSGDVVVVTRPPYQSDAGTDDVKISLSHFFGQHGYLPNTVDLPNNINMHGTWVLAGPGVKHKGKVKNLRAVDIAPTLSLLMGIAGPQNARGAILYDILKGADKFHEVTILDVSDWHAQLTPLAEAADNIGTAPPTYATGGSAFYKKWFEIYEAEAKRSKIGTRVLEVMGGDSFGGATPPISNFFGDKPTPPIMAMMGIDIDAIGNHSFDRGEAYLRSQLIPLAKFPMISSNVVFPNGKTPKEWSKSKIIDVGHGIKVGFVGFTTVSTPEVVFPGNLGPFEVRPLIPAVNAEAAKIAKKTDVIVALGHEGATAGTITNPTGPLIDLADAVVNVDAVIGDHNDLQVNSVRSNGVIVTENRGKGLRFTRVRLVVGPGKDGVVYKTADYHKPWDLGLTPDAAIQAKINELNAELAPILGAQIGASTKPIPRADQCGSGDGRLCESLVGDLVTDAMLSTYSSIGAEFAITNSGGLRADLTCPLPDIPDDFCGSYTPPPYVITRGQSLAVLPFGNVAVTVVITGAELKAMLENGVSRSVSLDPTPLFPGQTPPLTGPPTLLPSAQGRFPQVSGLCFTWSPNLPPGSRVTSVVDVDDEGDCSETEIDLSASETYKVVQNDFIAAGGDGYPNVASRMTTQEILEEITADYVTANSPVSPVVKAAPDGRINCLDTNGTLPTELPNCPVFTASP